MTNDQLPAVPGVYSIFCHANKKFYVGGAVNVRARIRGHFSRLFRDAHQNRHLQAAWNKYGVQTFEAEVLEVCTLGNVRAREQAWLDAIKSSRCAIFNQHYDATSTLGFRFSAEQRAKQAFGNKISLRAQAHRRKLHAMMKGRHLSSETKKKLSASLCRSIKAKTQRLKLNEKVKAGLVIRMRGKYHSTETKTKMALSQRSSIKAQTHLCQLNAALKAGIIINRGMTGRKHSIETRVKMAEAQRRRMTTPEVRMKISEKLRGRVISLGMRKKLSDATRKQMANPEARAKISIAQRRYWARRKGETA